jgi:hypothetical protein
MEAVKLVSDAITVLPPENVDLLMRKPVIFPCAHEVKTVDT